MSAYDYKPTATDVRWAQSTIDLIADRGILAFPAAQLTYQVRKTDKSLFLLNSIGAMNTPLKLVTHWMTIVVFARIGYSVKSSPEIALRVYSDRHESHEKECTECSAGKPCNKGSALLEDFYAVLKDPSSEI